MKLQRRFKIIRVGELKIEPANPPMWTTGTHYGVFCAPAETYFDRTWQLPDMEKSAKSEKSVD